MRRPGGYARLKPSLKGNCRMRVDLLPLVPLTAAVVGAALLAAIAADFAPRGNPESLHSRLIECRENFAAAGGDIQPAVQVEPPIARDPANPRGRCMRRG